MKAYIYSLIIITILSCSESQEPKTIVGNWYGIQSRAINMIIDDSLMVSQQSWITHNPEKIRHRKNLYQLIKTNRKYVYRASEHGINDHEVVLIDDNYLYSTSFKTSPNRSGTISGIGLFVRDSSLLSSEKIYDVTFPSYVTSAYVIQFEDSLADYRIGKGQDIHFEDIILHQKKVDVNNLCRKWFNFYYYENDKKIPIRAIYNLGRTRKQHKELHENKPLEKFVYVHGFNRISHTKFEEVYGRSISGEGFFFEIGTIEELQSASYLKRKVIKD